jgi:hypothetical protein
VTTWASVGKSRFGDLRGVEQFMEIRAAGQVLSLIAFIATLPGCRRLTINEGRRTRPRQSLLRRAYEAHLRGGPWAPLAAVEFTSRHDEIKHGNAADLGGPNGEALNAAERAAISKYGPAFGVHFVGLTFDPPEPWHVEGDMVTPVPDWGKVAAASSSATPFPSVPTNHQKEEDTMSAPFLIKRNLTGTIAVCGIEGRGFYEFANPNEYNVARIVHNTGASKLAGYVPWPEELGGIVGYDEVGYLNTIKMYTPPSQTPAVTDPAALAASVVAAIKVSSSLVADVDERALASQIAPLLSASIGDAVADEISARLRA